MSLEYTLKSRTNGDLDKNKQFKQNNHIQFFGAPIHYYPLNCAPWFSYSDILGR